MPLDLLKRSESASPLTAEQHDTNFTAIETEVNAKADTSSLGALATKSIVETTDLTNDGVTFAKIQNLSANVLIGAINAGDPVEITCTAAGRALLDDANAAAQRITLSAELLVGQRTITDNATLVLTDESLVIYCNKATAMTVTIPTNATVPFPLNTKVYINQYGAGAVSIVGAAGVTVRKPADLSATTRGQYYTASLLKRGTNEWILGGGLEQL